jgi:hypothetical protein
VLQDDNVERGIEGPVRECEIYEIPNNVQLRVVPGRIPHGEIDARVTAVLKQLTVLTFPGAPRRLIPACTAPSRRLPGQPDSLPWRTAWRGA